MLMAVQIDQVAAFVTIVRRGGFTRAASTLPLSQPAVSRRLHLLERCSPRHRLARARRVDEKALVDHLPGTCGQLRGTVRVGAHPATRRGGTIPALRATMPFVLVHRRPAYRSGAARRLMVVLEED
jgi:hypothetical protein